KDGALLVGEHDRARAVAGRGAHAARRIDAGDVAWTADVADSAAEVDDRPTEREAVAQPAERQVIGPPMEIERAAAGGAPDHEAGLDDAQVDEAAVGHRRWRRGKAGDRAQCDERGMKTGHSHD